MEAVSGSRFGSQTASEPLMPGLVADCPKIVWIELTSRCPLRCIFCSRKHQRGVGQHMSFALYESLIRQLKGPEIIRLNYSGESLHYPRLPEAIRLARATGATTELVSTLATAPDRALRAIVDAGLHRLSVSLHTMDAGQFRSIYGGGDIANMRGRLEYLRRYKAERASQYPEIDFAFVAMRENLCQLSPVAEYAQACGITRVSVHPVIRRSAIPAQFPRELDESGELREEFAADVRRAVETVAACHPGISAAVARPQRAEAHHAGAAPCDAVTTCEQNPWETVHVLAGGGIVVCEVQDATEIGNLQRESLHAVWNGAKYRSFRRRYVNGAHPACAKCPWRTTVAASPGQKVLVRGWHPCCGETVQWSQKTAALTLAIPPGVAGIRLSGLLPPPPEGSTENRLTIRQASTPAIQIVNGTGELVPFEAVMPAQAPEPSHATVLRFETSHRFCPAERGHGPDLRRLGFALAGLTLQFEASRREKVRRLLHLLERVERVSALHKSTRRTATDAAPLPRSGVSVLVPARETPDLLAPTLAAAAVALSRIEEPSELIVVMSGTQSASGGGLRHAIAGASWIIRPDALSYVDAVALGLARAKHPWIYLLNSDMYLQPPAVAEVLQLRRWDTFAVGSRIRMKDGSCTETNWTDFRYREADAVELIERDPADLCEPRGCLYVGGGSGLFRASLLGKWLRRTRVYAPFYWEDVEWGTLAWRNGYQCVFCPSSEAVHGRRQTIARYYSEPEVSRIFERNRLLFHLRNLRGVRCLEERLLSLDRRSWAELFQPAVLAGTVWARARAFMAPCSEEILLDRWKVPLSASSPTEVHQNLTLNSAEI